MSFPVVHRPGYPVYRHHRHRSFACQVEGRKLGIGLAIYNLFVCLRENMGFDLLYNPKVKLKGENMGLDLLFDLLICLRN